MWYKYRASLGSVGAGAQLVLRLALVRREQGAQSVDCVHGGVVDLHEMRDGSVDEALLVEQRLPLEGGTLVATCQVASGLDALIPIFGLSG